MSANNPAATPDSASTVPANTVRAYANDWIDFVSWCERQDLDPGSADGGDVVDYLHELHGRGLAASSVVRAYSGIAWHLRQLAPTAWPRGWRPAECAAILRDLRRSMPRNAY